MPFLVKAASKKPSGVTFKVVEGEIKVLMNDQEVGSLEFWKTSTPGLCQLNYVGVKPAFHRQGIAEQALKFFKKEMKKRGFNRIESQITWTGAYNMMKKVFKKPDGIYDAIREYEEKDLLKMLPNVSPANEEGKIEDAEYLDVYWRI